jgi:hypothetical protein
MSEPAAFHLHAWGEYYVIVGTSAGALTGLQFVVMTLISESGRVRGTNATLSAFATPNVIHFCAALLLSALMTVPWPSSAGMGMALNLVGAAGTAYSLLVLGKARRQKDYKPVLEDWVWHAILPLMSYLALIVSGILLAVSPLAPFLVAASTLLLVFIGVHNAWDTVMYVLLDRLEKAKAPADEPPAPPEARS